MLSKFPVQESTTHALLRRPYIKKIKLIALGALVLLLGSCFTNNWLVTVKPDGSGTINMNFSMDQSVIGMMQGMTGGQWRSAPAVKRRT